MPGPKAPGPEHWTEDSRPPLGPKARAPRPNPKARDASEKYRLRSFTNSNSKSCAVAKSGAGLYHVVACFVPRIVRNDAGKHRKNGKCKAFNFFTTLPRFATDRRHCNPRYLLSLLTNCFVSNRIQKRAPLTLQLPLPPCLKPPPDVEGVHNHHRAEGNLELRFHDVPEGL